jgi:hypothetical protein
MNRASERFEGARGAPGPDPESGSPDPTGSRESWVPLHQEVHEK